MRLKYTDEHKLFIYENSHLDRKELTTRFNAKFSTKQDVTAIGLARARYGNKSALQPWRRSDAYTAEQLAYLRNNSQLARSELARKFNNKFNENRTVEAIGHARGKYGYQTKKAQTKTEPELIVKPKKNDLLFGFLYMPRPAMLSSVRAQHE